MNSESSSRWRRLMILSRTRTKFKILCQTKTEHERKSCRLKCLKKFYFKAQPATSHMMRIPNTNFGVVRYRLLQLSLRVILAKWGIILVLPVDPTPGHWNVLYTISKNCWRLSILNDLFKTRSVSAYHYREIKKGSLQTRSRESTVWRWFRKAYSDIKQKQHLNCASWRPERI